MGTFRFLSSSLLAAGVTFGLFMFMYALISLGGDNRTAMDAISGIRFGPIEIPDEISSRSRRKPPKPPPRENPPPSPEMRIARMNQPQQEFPRLDLPNIDLPLVGGGGIFIGNFQQIDQTAEGDIVPVVIIRPIYPREAAMNGTEGWVKVEFTITEVGTVKSPRVVDAQPPRIFNREAIRAILKWKFKPRVVDGVAVERRATQIIDFSLDDT